MTITTIILESDDVVPQLVEGAVVRFFDTGGSLITSGTSNASGEVVVDIPDADYDIYAFKSGMSVNDGLPQRITVDVGDPPNTFTVAVHLFSLPESIDPKKCRVSGNLIGLDGNPSKDGHLVFGSVVETGIIYGNILTPQGQLRIKPNDDGYYEFDLLRGVEYCAYFYMLETLFRTEPPSLFVVVPDMAAVDIKDLLFPVPVSAEFDSNTIALNAGDPDDNSISFVITYSDGTTNSDRDPPKFISNSISSDDDDVATAELQYPDKVIITPRAAGVANLTISRTISSSIVYNPEPNFTTETIVVTVS